MNSSQCEANKELLIRHFQDGCKLNCVQKLGLEVEHFIVDKNGHAVSYYGEAGVEAILKELAPHFPHVERHGENLIGFYNNDYSISLEPAAQFEISISPRESIHSIDRIYYHFRQLLDPILAKHGYHFETIGYQPSDCVDDLPLIPKERYEFMDRYFQKVDTRGRNMMRGTASTQVSIDYCSEEDFVQKFRAAYICMPIIKLLTDNAKVFEGAPYEGRLLRTTIWDHVDPARCGIVPGVFDESFGFAAYADYIMQVPLIFRPVDGLPVYTGTANAMELWADKPFTPEDIDHVLSMVFPDVRLKHYVEIRGADSMQAPYVNAYLAFIKGLFFHENSLQKLLSRFDFVDATAIRDTEAALVRQGFDAEIYGVPARTLALELLELSASHLADSERSALYPFCTLAQNCQAVRDMR